MRNTTVIRIRNGLFRVSGLLIIAALWELAPRCGWINGKFFPSLTTVAGTIAQQWQEGFLWVHCLVSVWRTIIGLLLALAVGIPGGLLLGYCGNRWVETFNPLLRLASQANPFSLMPVFMLFFGIGETAKIAVIAWVCLWPLLFNTVTGVRNIDPQLVKAARSLKVKGIDYGLSVLLPHTAAYIFTGLRIGVEMAFFMLIASEMIGATAGLGWLLHASAHLNEIPRMFAAATTIILLGMIINGLLRKLDQRLYFWRDNETQSAVGRIAKPPHRLQPWEIAMLMTALLGIIVYGGQLANQVNQTGGIRFENSRHPHGSSAPNFGNGGGL